MSRGHNQTGRSLNPNGHFALLPCAMLKSAAWRALGGNSVRVLLELMTRHIGPDNNGDLFLSLEEAADRLHIGKATALRAYRDLEEKGFLVKTSPGTFRKGDAATWRLTFKPAKGRVGTTDEWRRWQAPERPPRKRKPWGGWKKAAHERLTKGGDPKRFPGSNVEPIGRNTVSVST